VASSIAGMLSGVRWSIFDVRVSPISKTRLGEVQHNGFIGGSFACESEQYRGLNWIPATNVWIVQETEAELDRQGLDWPPFKSGLFDGPIERFRSFKNEVDKVVAKSAADFFRN
jgi:hypothetical protein